MRKGMKFSKGGRADAMRERRMADIESDYKKAIAKGKSEKEAQAKRDQRIADAKDDYAKRTGADRTETRAAEKAAEARLSAARRSPDKDMKSVSVASEGPAKVDTSAMTTKVDTPKVAMSTPKAAPKATPKPVRRAADKPQAKPPVRYGANFGKPAVASTATDKKAAPASTPAADKGKSIGRRMAETSAKRQQGQMDELGGTLGKIGSGLSWFFSGKNRDKKAKGGKVKTYAKGGSVDGIAVRGKTKAKRKK